MAPSASRHHWSSTVPARTARTAIMTGPITATAAGSSRQAGLSSPKITSEAPRPAPCMAAVLAARRR
eukprot:2598770-Lingulodinium_polyedra.AAC.1